MQILATPKEGYLTGAGRGCHLYAAGAELLVDIDRPHDMVRGRGRVMVYIVFNIVQ